MLYNLFDMFLFKCILWFPVFLKLKKFDLLISLAAISFSFMEN